MTGRHLQQQLMNFKLKASHPLEGLIRNTENTAFPHGTTAGVFYDILCMIITSPLSKVFLIPLFAT